MTPKEKAIYLVAIFYTEVEDFQKYETQRMTKDMAIQCALICVNHILKAREVSDGGLILDGAYWEEVKEEIEKL